MILEPGDVIFSGTPGGVGLAMDPPRFLKTGDVVVQFDGENVRSARQFTRLVSESSTQRPVKIGVIREGKRLDVEATLTVAEPPEFAELTRSASLSIEVNRPPKRRLTSSRTTRA